MGVMQTVASWFRSPAGPRASAVRREIDPQSRETTYGLNEALYTNTQYDFWREYILSNYFPTFDPKSRIVGHFNPIKEIVDLYVSNVLPGTWNAGTEVAPEVDREPVNAKLPPLLTRVWRDSNLDTAKSEINERAAKLGTVGLRVTVSRPDPRAAVDRGAPSRVRISYDHPGRLFHVEQDGFGNVLVAVLKYQTVRNFGNNVNPSYELVDVVEEITRDDFSRTVGGIQEIPDDARINRWGFCPYVILRHRENGTVFGDWSFRGSEAVVHAINYRITQQDLSIGRGLFPKWFLGSAGDPPKSIRVGGDTAAWSQLTPDTPPPFMEAIVAQIDHGDAKDFWMETVSLLQRRQPEMAVNNLQLFSNISGESVAQILKQAESAVLNVRPRYDHAYIRALQMAVSAGTEERVPGFEVGAGTGPGSGDRAYNEGLLAFEFADRPALPETPAAKIAGADAAVADDNARLRTAAAAQKAGVDTKRVLITAGYSPAEADQIIAARRTQDVSNPEGGGL
jgi:hypothetical protein